MTTAVLSLLRAWRVAVAGPDAHAAEEQDVWPSCEAESTERTLIPVADFHVSLLRSYAAVGLLTPHFSRVLVATSRACQRAALSRGHRH